MRQHIDILGWLFVAMGGLGILVAIFVFAILGVTGGLTGDVKSAALLGSIGLFVAIFIAVFSLPNIVAGWGLLKRKSWSRVLAIILGALSLLSFPLGTALGVYAIWALTKPEAQEILSS